MQRAPRGGETAEQIAAAQAVEEEEHAIFELEIVREVELDLGPNPQGGNEQQAQRGQNTVPGQQQVVNPPAEGGDAAGNGNNNNAQAPNNWLNGLEFRHDMSAMLSADTIISALFFLAVAAAMGEVLKISLPAK